MTPRRPHPKPGTPRFTWPVSAFDPHPARTTDLAHDWAGELHPDARGELRDGTGWRVSIAYAHAAGRYALTLTLAHRGADVPGCKLRAALLKGIVTCDLRVERTGLVGLVRGVMLRGTAVGRVGAWRLEGSAIN